MHQDKHNHKTHRLMFVCATMITARIVTGYVHTKSKEGCTLSTATTAVCCVPPSLTREAHEAGIVSSLRQVFHQ